MFYICQKRNIQNGQIDSNEMTEINKNEKL